MIQHQEKELTIFESALFRTTSTVFYNEDLILIVDPNWLPAEVKTIRDFVDSIQQGQPIYLLFTHSDYDHIIASGAFPEAQCIASKAFVDNPKKAAILQQIREFDESYYIQRDYPIDYPIPDILVEKDGQRWQIGKTTLTFYLAPGHNADGIFTLIEPQGICLVGDYLSNIEFPYVYHSFADYEKTLATVDFILAHHPLRLLIPGHGDFTDSKTEILQRKKESEVYIQALRKSILEGKDFDLAQLWERYDFPAGMLPFHEGNIKLLREEYSE